MDRLQRILLKISGLLVLLVIIFPPFKLGNGQPEWGFIGSPPLVTSWVTWDEILSNNFHHAGIHWGFLTIEVVAIILMAFSIWISEIDNGHHRRH